MTRTARSPATRQAHAPSDASAPELQAALLAGAGPMLAIDRQGRCRFANPAAAALAANPGALRDGVDARAHLRILADPGVASVIAKAWTGAEGEAEATMPGSPRCFAVRAVPAGEHVLLYLDEATERLAAERAADEATETVRLASLAGATGNYSIDLASNSIWFSERALRIYGIDPADGATLPADRLVSLVLPEDLETNLAAVARARANPGAVYDVTYRVRRPVDGELRTIHSVGEVLRDRDGVARTLVGSISDVTDRSAAEEALRISEDRLRKTVEGVDAIISFREDGRSEVIQSPQIERILGYRPEELTDNFKWDDLVHPDDVAQCLEAWQGPEPEWALTYRIRRADGTYIWVDDRGRWIDREGGRGRGLIGVITDITARKRVEQALEESEERLRRVFEGVDAILTYREPGGGPIIQSPQVERILGFRADELTTGAAWEGLVHHDDVQDARETWEGPNDSWSLTYRMRRKDGAWIWVEDRGQRIHVDDGREPGMFAVAVDITARKRIEEALAESEERLRHIVEGVDAVITYLEAGGQPTIQSPQVERILGYPPEALTTEEAWYDLVHPDDLARCLAAWDTESPTWVVTYRMRRADGAWIWVDDRGQRIYHEDGRRPGYVGVVADVTDRVEASQARRLADERRRRLFEANIVGTVVAESGGRLLEANDYFLRLVGRSREALVQGELTWQSVTAAASIALDEDAIEQCRETGSSRPYEKVYLRPDGSSVAALIVLASMPGPGEQVAAFVLDLTERNAAAAEMAQLVAAIEQTSESVVITDLDAGIRYVNPAFETVSGYTRAEAIGQNPRILHSGVHPPEFFDEMWQTLLRGETWRGELVNRRKDGTLYNEVAAISPIRDASGAVTAYVAVKRDITAERELQARLSQAQRLEAIGQLAGGIAHDFNNLLAVIRGYADLARAAMPPGGAAGDDLDQVVLAADRASSLTRQLLLFSRRQAMEAQVVDPAAVIDGLAPMLRRLLGEHIDLEVAAAVPSAGLVRVDPGQLEQVVINLSANARDAMPDGGRLTIRTEPHDEAGAPWVRLTVSDTGMGMDGEIAQHIFEPFFTTKGVGKGTGLGLATVYGIVTESGGRVRVASAPGDGTVFTIDLPRVEVPQVTAEPGVEAPPASARRSRSVLLVEDDPAVRSLTRRMLVSLGHMVMVASSGAEALGLIEVADRLPDVLVTDVRMPGIQGPELARRLRDRRPDLPVVFTSGFSAELGEQLAIQGAQMLDKPFDLRRLDAAIRAALGPEA